MKKGLGKFAVTFVTVGLLITLSASATLSMPTEDKPLKLIKLEKIAGMEKAKCKKVDVQVNYRSLTSLDPIPLYYGAYPTIASDSTNILLGFEAEDNVWFTGSTNGGVNWPENAVALMLEEPPEKPDADSCGDGRFLATMVPNPWDYEGSALYKFTITDVGDFENGYSASIWIWNELGITDFIDVAVGAYTAEDPAENTWAYGGHSMIGNSDDWIQTPLFSYQFNEEGYAWIYWWTSEEYPITYSTCTSMDIDPVTLYSYAVWNFDNAGIKDILVFICDFSRWEPYDDNRIHPGIGGYIISSEENDDYLDVSAHNNNVIIVSERAGNIVAYYSKNAMTSIEEVIIDSGEKPRIVHSGDNTASCIFMKDGELYHSITMDGGATWSPSIKVAENVVSADVSLLGGAYESEGTIYFEPEIGGPSAIIEIRSISGGIGVKAEIANIGQLDAEDLEWSITIKGGILGMIYKKSEGTVTIPAGEKVKIKSGLVVGIGSITVEIKAGAATKTVKGKQLGPFTIIR